MIPRTLNFDKLTVHWWAACLLISNLFVSLGTELAHDEAYYWLFSKHLAWGYFDHPPLTAWMIALTQWIPGELGVRLPFILSMQLVGYLLSRMVPEVNRKYVWIGLNLFPLLAFAGVFAIPDGPLVIMSAIWLWSLKRALEKDNYQNAVIMGFASALLLYGKYHGVLYIVATLLAVPSLFKKLTFWLATILALVLFTPHLYWQWSHDFATLHYHFIDRPAGKFSAMGTMGFILLQLILPGLLCGPLIWREFFKKKAQSEFQRALKFITVFVVGFFLFSSFSKQVEGNWTVAAGMSLLLYVLSFDMSWADRRWVRGLGLASLMIMLFGRLLLVFPPDVKALNRTSEFHGWEDWAKTVADKAGECHLVANRYQFASKLSFYLDKEVPALNIGTRLNQFEYWDTQEAWRGRPVCWVTERKLFPGELLKTPGGKKLYLVKGVSLDDIMKHKERSL